MVPNLSLPVTLEAVITTTSSAANTTKLAQWQLSVFSIFLFPMPLTLSFVNSTAIWHGVEESSSCNEPNLPLRHQGSPHRPTYLIVSVLSSLLWREVMKCYRKCTVFDGNTVVLNWIVYITYKEKMSFLYIEIGQVIKILPAKDVYPTKSLPWLLMTWRYKEPGHQQPCYWRSSPRIFHP